MRLVYEYDDGKLAWLGGKVGVLRPLYGEMPMGTPSPHSHTRRGLRLVRWRHDSGDPQRRERSIRIPTLCLWWWESGDYHFVTDARGRVWERVSKFRGSE